MEKDAEDKESNVGSSDEEVRPRRQSWVMIRSSVLEIKDEKANVRTFVIRYQKDKSFDHRTRWDNWILDTTCYLSGWNCLKIIKIWRIERMEISNLKYLQTKMMMWDMLEKLTMIETGQKLNLNSNIT